MGRAKDTETGSIAELGMEAFVREENSKKRNDEELLAKHTICRPYEGSDPFLFVSYSHRDVKEVGKVLDFLEGKKYRIWFDDALETGRDFREELSDRIQKSKGVLLFVSRDSMASPFCGMEILEAVKNGKDLYPIFLDDEDVVPPSFEIFMNKKQHGNSNDLEKLKVILDRDLPPETMDRLVKSKDGLMLEKCADNGNEIEVDEGVIVIKEGAFKERRGFEIVKLPKSLEKIEKEAFRGCSKLKAMVIPEKTVSVGESAFRDCVSMESLQVMNSCIKLGERAFENCASLSEITLPDDLTEIYGGVFNSCRKLKSIHLPEKLTILGESAFSDCDALESIEIPDSVTKIDDLVFNGCVSMKEVKLSEGLKKIGKSAFKNCHSLKNITIPSSVTSISDAPFRGCESLSSIIVDRKNKYYKSAPIKPNDNDLKGHVLFNKNKSVLIAYPAASSEVQYDVPDSVTTISEWAFCESKKLARIRIPDSVTEIGEGAFSGCTVLDEMEIPDSVIKIDDCAFRNCRNLGKVSIPDSVTELGWGLFDGCEKNLKVYCNENSEAWKYCQRNRIETRSMEQKEYD